MTIANTPRKSGPFVGTGSETTFSFAFKIFNRETDLKVYRSLTSDSTRIPEELTYGTDYTVVLNESQDETPGGTVTLTEALETGKYLTILSNVSYDQNTKFTNYDNFMPTLHNAALDKLTALTQQLKEHNDRTITVPPTSSETPQEILDSIFTARDTAVQKASDAAASATIASQKEAEVTNKYNLISPHFASIEGVYGIRANVGTVASIKTDVQTVASKINSIESVSQNINEIQSVSQDLNNIDSLASRSIALSNLSANLGSIISIDNNIGYIQSALIALPDILNAKTHAKNSEKFSRKSEAWAECPDSDDLATSSGAILSTTSGIDLHTRSEVEVLGGEHSSMEWARLSKESSNASKNSEENSSVWAEGTDEEVEALGGKHSAAEWAKISKRNIQANWLENSSGSPSFILNKPVVDSTTSLLSNNAISNSAITARIEEIWSWIYNASGWDPILQTTSGIDLMTSANEILVADHA